MSRALVIDSSSRYVGSVTRALTQQFISTFEESNGESNLVYRDLAKSSVPHLSAEAIEGFFSPTPSLRAKRATVLSDLLLEEFLGADLICIGVPVYNFNLPSALKAYLDQIVRIGKTFQKQGDGRLQGLCSGKDILVLYSMGGMYKDTDMDFIKPYFKAITNFIGADRVDFVAIEGTSRAGFKLEDQLGESGELIQNYLAKRGKKENTLLSMLSE
ncbi:NAD(P)H-dependent oxidoreductase [Neptuniibacter sp.]|uniref:FMN-dependent NADH-azoreductase n=1 Tax=Neptuniibacter sp. TaxID=1962643 RepID=UPI00261A3B1C|nr:NAD(P)H-dependent oxidoreductase [Neptuniibacter sp.]MCP4596379.1 FMN-dependent NADH-azoreductase [Neptuniibacter sp.]